MSYFVYICFLRGKFNEKAVDFELSEFCCHEFKGECTCNTHVFVVSFIPSNDRIVCVSQTIMLLIVFPSTRTVRFGVNSDPGPLLPALSCAFGKVRNVVLAI